MIDRNLNMSIIPGYQIENQIYESANTIIFRGQRIKDMCPVTMKVLKREYPTSNEILDLKMNLKSCVHLTPKVSSR
jgi:hypothetical protein